MGRLDMETGFLEEAIERLARLQASLSAGGDEVESLEVAIHLADALLRSGDTTRALEVVKRAEDVAGAEGALFAAGIARVRSRALWELGDLAGAARVSVRGVGAAVDAALPYEEALLRDWRIQMATSQDSMPEAEDLTRRDELHDGLGIRSPA
jgi:ATP/maltotriose-dependent transcriptional regulator MalT